MDIFKFDSAQLFHYWLLPTSKSEYDAAGPKFGENLKMWLESDKSDAVKDDNGIYTIRISDGTTRRVPPHLLTEKPGKPEGLPTSLRFQTVPPLVLNPYRNAFVKRIKNYAPDNYHYELTYEPQFQLVSEPFEFTRHVSVGPSKVPPKIEGQEFVSLYINRKSSMTTGLAYKPEPLYLTLLDVPLIGNVSAKVPVADKAGYYHWSAPKHSKYMLVTPHNLSGTPQIRLGMGKFENQLEEVMLMFQQFVENQFKWLWREQNVHIKFAPFCVTDEFVWEQDSDTAILGPVQIQPIIKASVPQDVTAAQDGNPIALTESNTFTHVWNKMCLEHPGTADITLKAHAWGQYTGETQNNKPVLKVGLSFKMEHVNFHLLA